VGAVEAAEIRCRAWTELGNAYRVADDLDLADQALERAAVHLPEGSRDGLLGARYLTVLASQLGARRSFREACATLDEVAGIYRRHGDEHLAGRALVMKGIFLGYGGDPEGAVRVIESGLATVDPERDRGLVFSALQSQAWFLVDCGRYSDARMALLDLRRRKLDPGGRVNELKLRWLEGHICAGLEQLDRAEQALVQVKDGFTEAGLRFKAALAGLELGAVRLRQNHYAEAVAAVLESTDVFLSLRIEREVMASVVLLRKAGELRTLTLGFLNKVIETLHHAERDPNARPQPAVEP
jgi:tetratricopeptide (TPR) repeat protein